MQNALLLSLREGKYVSMNKFHRDIKKKDLSKTNTDTVIVLTKAPEEETAKEKPKKAN